ncbi:MAG: hypothetical protein KKD44_14700 [Proteobacteria bacterium]|nr:hypothetical protein [Pseudomonadota bacterium]
MTKHIHQREEYCQEYLEYHGNTSILRIRKYPRNVTLRKWLLFDTVEDALDYFNSEIEYG